MTKYHIIGYLSFLIALIIFIFNFFDATWGKIAFGVCIGAGIKFLADGVLLKSDMNGKKAK